jgi:hypothetical protein
METIHNQYMLQFKIEPILQILVDHACLVHVQRAGISSVVIISIHVQNLQKHRKRTIHGDLHYPRA